MRVAVVESRQHGTRLGVDEARFRSLEFQNFGVLPDGENAAVLDGDRFGEVKLIIDGDDVGVMDDEVGWACRWGIGGERQVGSKEGK